MIPVPGGVRVWLATGPTDMRKGFNRLLKKCGFGLFGLWPSAGAVFALGCGATIGRLWFALQRCAGHFPVITQRPAAGVLGFAGVCKVKAALTLARPRTFTWATPPTALVQPKISSIRLRLRWLTA